MALSILKATGRFFELLSGKFKAQGWLSEYRRFDEGRIHRTVKLINQDNIKIGKGTEVKDYVIIQSFGKVVVGENCQINPFTVFYAGEILIGDNVMIAPHCMLASGNHDYKQLSVPMRFAGNVTKGPIIIEDDVWLGANVTITDGVRIGKGSVVGANTCVNKDVLPYSVVVGPSFRVIGKRGGQSGLEPNESV